MNKPSLTDPHGTGKTDSGSHSPTGRLRLSVTPHLDAVLDPKTRTWLHDIQDEPEPRVIDSDYTALEARIVQLHALHRLPHDVVLVRKSWIVWLLAAVVIAGFCAGFVAAPLIYGVFNG